MYKDESFASTVRRDWSNHDHNLHFSNQLVQCRRTMAQWKRMHRINAAEDLQQIRVQIDRATRDPTVSITTIHALQRQLNQAYADEEEFWRLKSRNRWLAFGDKNTKFYQSTTKIRRAKNKIKSITDDQGIVHTKDEAIALVAGRIIFSELIHCWRHSLGS